jgi:hypothetical protein
LTPSIATRNLITIATLKSSAESTEFLAKKFMRKSKGGIHKMNGKKITLTEEQFELLMGCLEQCMNDDQISIEKCGNNPCLVHFVEMVKSDLEKTEELYKILQES